MPKYRVHVYAVVRVPFDIEAKSWKEAIKESEHRNLYVSFRDGEYTEMVTGYVVDTLKKNGEVLRWVDTDHEGKILFKGEM